MLPSVNNEGTSNMKMSIKTLPVKGSKGTRTMMQLHGRAGNVVYYVRNGRQYIRRYAVPGGGGTERQQLHRQLFAAAVENARIVYGNAHLRKPYEQLWIEHGENRRMSLYNYIVHQFLVLR